MGKLTLFLILKRLGVLHSTLDGMLVHRRSTPRIELLGKHFYTWAERGTARVTGKCLTQELNTTSPARAPKRNTQ